MRVCFRISFYVFVDFWSLVCLFSRFLWHCWVLFSFIRDETYWERAREFFSLCTFVSEKTHHWKVSVAFSSVTWSSAGMIRKISRILFYLTTIVSCCTQYLPTYWSQQGISYWAWCFFKVECCMFCWFAFVWETFDLRLTAGSGLMFQWAAAEA